LQECNLSTQRVARTFGPPDLSQLTPLLMQHFAIKKQQCVERLILDGGRHLPFTAKSLKNLSSWKAPISRGCRLPWNKMKRLIQSRYERSVRIE
jgi:hypothetical protein